MVASIVVSVFVGTALLAGVVLYRILSRGDVFRARVAKLMPEQESIRLVPSPGKWQEFLVKLGSRMRVKATDVRIYRDMIAAAGFRGDKVYVLLGGKLLLAAALPVSYLLLFALPRGKVGGLVSLMLMVILGISGFLLPSYWLSRKASMRKEEIFHSLPDVLDLLTVCVEAGLSLDAALIRTAENFEYKKDPLIQELNSVILEISAGKPRVEALRGLAGRTGVEDIKSFVTMVVQTERFGTGLGKTMRIYSDSLRIKRRQIAEEKAAKTGVKMLFPLTFCVFPALMVVMLVPAFFHIYSVFKR